MVAVHKDASVGQAPLHLVELHCHSTCSDGVLSPGEMAARAQLRNVELFALTDHDSCEGTPEALVPCAHVLRGAELSCSDEQQQTVHLLVYEVGAGWDLMMDTLVQVRADRLNRLRMMHAKLVQRGIRIDIEPLLAQAQHRTVGRPDLARAMVAAGVVKTQREAFTRHLYDRGPVDVPHRTLSVSAALDLARAAGARVSLAHPHLYGDRTLPLIARHRNDGLDGLEAFYGAYNTSERAHWQAVADQHHMVCTGGSDSHGEAHLSIGVAFPVERYRALRAWLGIA